MTYKIIVQPGNGGNGANSFKVTKGNKLAFDGGRGGNGGNIILRSNQLTLPNIDNKNTFISENGADGKKHKKNGKSGACETIYLCRNCLIEIKHGNEHYYHKYYLTIKQKNAITFKGGRGGLGSLNHKRKTQQLISIGEKPRPLKLAITPILEIGICIIYLHDTKEFIHNFIQQQYSKPMDSKSEYNCNIINGIPVYTIWYKNQDYTKLINNNYLNIVLYNSGYTDKYKTVRNLLLIKTDYFHHFWGWLMQYITYR